MVNDRSKKSNNDEKNQMRKSLLSGSCKPCTAVERNGNVKETSSTTKGPSSNQTSNGNTCYARCGPPTVQKVSTTPCSAANAPGNVSTKKTDISSANDSCEVKPLSVTNPFIEKMDEDILYHIALGNKSHDLLNMFGDVKFVVMGGTPKRMEQFAYFMANQMKYELPAGTILNDISKNSHRYAMYKIGPILSVSHGMGTPSIGILLHELIKLMSHAGVKDPTFIRIGTCGGFNKKAGTVVISNKVVNDFMEPFYELDILGKKVRFPANLNQTVVNEILALSEPEDKFETIAGVTYCTDNFYEGSGRSDGAICEFTEQEGLNYYKELQKNGVVNLEMESLAFAALTCRAGIKSAVITVILSDRLETEQIKQSKEVLDEWQTRPQKLLAKYILKKLSIGGHLTTKVPISSSLSPDVTICKSCGGCGKIMDANTGMSTTSTKPTCGLSTTPADPTVCKSCGGVGKIVDATAGTSTTSTKPTFGSSSTTTNPTICKSCGGSGKGIDGQAVASTTSTKPTIGSTSTTTADPTVCKSCRGSGKLSDSSSGTTSNKPTTFTSTTPSGGSCNSCGGTGKSEQTTTSASTAKPTDFTSSATPSGSAACKPCGGTGKDASSIGTSTAKPSAYTSTVPTSSTSCKSCGGTGKDSSSIGTSSSTTKPSAYSSSVAPPDSNVCKPCGGSGKDASNIGTSTTKSSAYTSSTVPTSSCRSCGGTGKDSSFGTSTSTIKPSAYSSTSPSDTNVCKPCGGTGRDVSGTGTSTTKSSAYTTSTEPTRSAVCKPCGGTGKDQSHVGSSTTKSADISSSPGTFICKSCENANKSNDTNTGTCTARPADGTSSTTPSVAGYCSACGGTGKDSNSTSQTTESLLSPKCAGFRFNLTSTTKPANGELSTTSSAPTTCTSCMGSGKENGAKLAASSCSQATICKDCEGKGVVPSNKDGLNSTSTTNGSYICKPCTPGIGSSGTTTSEPKVKFMGSYGTCKPCIGTAPASVSNGGSTSTCGSTTVAPGSTTIRSCKIRTEINSLADPNGTANTSQGGFGPCKPCTGTTPIGGGLATQTSGTTTTKAPGSLSGSICKPCGGTTGGSTTFTPGTATTDPSVNFGTSTTSTPGTCTAAPGLTGNVCKPCGGTSAGSTTFTPGTSTTTAPGFAGNLCKPCGGTIGGSTTSAPGMTTTAAPGLAGSVCKPCGGTSSGSTTLTPGMTTGPPCGGATGGSTTLTPGMTTTAAPGFGGGVCKPCGGTAGTGSSTTGAPGFGGGVCKPCGGTAGTGTSTTGAPGFAGSVCKPCGGTSGTGTSTTGAPGFAGSVCKPCGGTAGTGTSTTGTPGFGGGVCKPCGGTAGTGTSTTGAPGFAGSVCKPCGGTSGTGTSTTGAPGFAGSVCKPCGGTAGTGTSTTGAPGLAGSVCKPCGGTTGSNTTGTPSITATTAPPGFAGGVCQPCGGTTGGLSSTPYTTTRPGNTNGTTTFSPSTTNPTFTSSVPTSNLDTTTSSTKSTTSAPTSGGVCKPCGATANGNKNALTAPDPVATCKLSDSDTTTTFPPTSTTTGSSGISGGVCKPCSGPGTGIDSTSTTMPGITTRPPEIGSICKTSPGTTTAPGTTSNTTASCEGGTSQLSGGITSKPDLEDNNNAGVQRKRSKCVPVTCYAADKSDKTPLPTTPKNYIEKDFDSSSQSTISNDSWRSCYEKCSSKAPASNGGNLSSTCKPQHFQTPEQDNMKGVPPALGPCCSSGGGVTMQEVPDAKGPACAACERKERRSSNGQIDANSTTRKSSFTDNTTRKSSFTDDTTRKSSFTDNTTRRTSFTDNTTRKSSLTDFTTRKSSLTDCSTRNPSFDSKDVSNDSKLGPCCSGQRKEDVTSRPVDSNDENKLGPCCTGKTAQSTNAPTASSVNSKQSGRLCSGKDEDSPDEICGGRGSLQENKGAQSNGTAPTKASSEPNGSGPFVGNLQGCPISIRTPCKYTKDDSSKIDSSDPSCATPKPSPETPDPSTTKAMPAFVTPTPPPNGNSCCTKFPNSSGIIYASNVSKEANKYDESPSPCAACKKYQEGKNKSTTSTSSDLQPEIIKCPHKLKRLKDECQGYD